MREDIVVGDRAGSRLREDPSIAAARSQNSRTDSVKRTRIIESLEDSIGVRLVSIRAPAGYGKTTLLSQWADSDPRPTAWLTLDRYHNDPRHLVEELARTMASCGIIDSDESTVLRRIGGNVDRLVARIAPTEPSLMMLDEGEAIGRPESRDVIVRLAESTPPMITVVVASRTDIGLPLAVLRASGGVVELSADDLAMTFEEVSRLAQRLGVGYGPDQIAALLDHTEGWPVGVYLSLLAASKHGIADPLDIRGDDRYLAEYLDSQIIDDLTPARRSFLVRCSVLDELSGPVCDWLLERSRSQKTLEDLSRSNLLVASLDRSNTSFRLHSLLREHLHDELIKLNPGLDEHLHHRASIWFERKDQPVEAVRHAMEEGEGDRVAELLMANAQPLFDAGRIATVSDWLAWFDTDQRRDKYPGVALLASMATSAQGDVVATERWRAAFDGSRRSLGPLEPLACLHDALAGVNGVDVMLTDARCAIRGLGRDSSWYPSALVLEGLALLVSGEEDAAIEGLQYAAHVAERYGSLPAAAFALAACSLHVGARGAPVHAGEMAARSRELLEGTDLERHATCVLTPVAVARCQMLRGDPGAARQTLHQAYGLMPLLTWALPVISAFTLLEMADTAIGLADIAGARQILREASRIGRKRPLGRLEDRLHTAEDLLDALPTGNTGASTLTAAELRLLPHLATHLSFPEIGERLYISRHTVKTQAMAIYRKLGASTRSEAVAAAREVGLLPVREL